MRVWAGGAVSRGMNIQKRWIRRPQVGLAEAKPLGDTGTESGDEDVCTGDDFQCDPTTVLRS